MLSPSPVFPNGQVFAELAALLAQPARLQYGPEELLEAFEAVALNPAHVSCGQSVVSADMS